MKATLQPFRTLDRTDRQARGRPSPRMKRFMARYIFYLEILGYTAVSLVALAVMACFFVQVDDVINSVGDPIPIKPRMETITRPADALVTRVLVRNHQPVRRGDPLVEVVENPRWIGRYLFVHQLRALLNEFPGPEASTGNTPAPAASAGDTTVDKKDTPPAPALSPEEEKLRDSARERVAEWDAQEAPHAPRIVLRSPIDGVAVVPEGLEFQRISAGSEILKVADLNDLRLTPRLSGDTVADARVGQEAIIKAIVPDYKSGTVFHGDTVPRGRYFWQRERVTAYSLLDPKIKQIVKDSFKDRKITQRDDLPFSVTEIKEVAVDADLSSGEGAPPAASGRPIPADAPADLELRGKVIEGKHRLSVQIADLPPAVTRQIREIVARQLQGRVLNAPVLPQREGVPVSVQPVRVDALSHLHIIAKVKGENKEAKGATKRLKEEAARTAVQGAPYEKISDARQFEATIRITDPPQFLKDQVLALMDRGKDVKAKVALKTGRRPVALLLLKR